MPNTTKLRRARKSTPKPRLRVFLTERGHDFSEAYQFLQQICKDDPVIIGALSIPFAFDVLIIIYALQNLI